MNIMDFSVSAISFRSPLFPFSEGYVFEYVSITYSTWAVVYQNETKKENVMLMEIYCQRISPLHDNFHVKPDGRICSFNYKSISEICLEKICWMEQEDMQNKFMNERAYSQLVCRVSVQ